MPPLAHRAPWNADFPPVVIHAEEILVKKHQCYAQAKAGDPAATTLLALDACSQTAVVAIRDWVRGPAILVPIHGLEASGVNAIPMGVAKWLAMQLGWAIHAGIVQVNVVGHTGANGFVRLANQALFDGQVEPGQTYVIVDDFIGQGGTIANLRGHILNQGGKVAGATVLTGKAFSAALCLPDELLTELRRKHGNAEHWWRRRFGFGFDCLTASEARYLIRTADEGTIISRITQASRP